VTSLHRFGLGKSWTMSTRGNSAEVRPKFLNDRWQRRSASLSGGFFGSMGRIIPHGSTILLKNNGKTSNHRLEAQRLMRRHPIDVIALQQPIQLLPSTPAWRRIPLGPTKSFLLKRFCQDKAIAPNNSFTASRTVAEHIHVFRKRLSPTAPHPHRQTGHALRKSTA
jgi:hypothetical protein